MRKDKGFTLAELLIVVAIIAVLVAIAIPIFSSYLEKAREAVDGANIRAKYAEMMSEVVSGKYNLESDKNKYVVELTQLKDEWQTTFDLPLEEVGKPKAKGKATLYYSDKAYVSYGTSTDKGSDSQGSAQHGTSQNLISKAIACSYDSSNPNKKFQLTAGTLYSYNGNYYIATQDKNDVKGEPKDNASGLFLVDTSKVYTIPTKGDYSSLTNVENKRGLVLYIQDENKYYVSYDTNSSFANAKMIAINN